MYDEQHFTRDAARVTFDDSAEGITVDDSGNASFEWDDVETVTIENPPHAEAFDSKEFYKIPATVAKPIPQPYRYGEDAVWLKKPRGELKKAAWSLDNAPWTHGHPDTGMVKNVDDVHGFWSNPRYIDSLDDLDADLHVPVGDDESKEYLEDNGDVSVGFYNKIIKTDAYDGVVGGADDDNIEIEGYQTNMLFDHVASVGRGRCPSEEGCGVDLDVDSDAHGHITALEEGAFKKGTRIMNPHDEDEGTTSVMAESTDAPSGIHVADGRWFAVGPDEHSDDSTEWPDDSKFPVNNCTDINDAWNLRGTGDISISESTLEERIQRAAEAKGCQLPDTAEQSDEAIAESAKRYSICGARKHVMEDRECGCTTETTDDSNMSDEEDTNITIDFDDLSVEAAFAKVAEQNDGVDKRLDELREAEEAAEVAENAAEELELDSVDELSDKVGLIKEQNEKLREQLDELQRPQMQEDAEYIAEHTDRFGEDAEEVIENLDEEPETVADKRELVEDLSSQYDEQTANPDDGNNEGSSTSTSGKYAKTPW